MECFVAALLAMTVKELEAVLIRISSDFLTVPPRECVGSAAYPARCGRTAPQVDVVRCGLSLENFRWARAAAKRVSSTALTVPVMLVAKIRSRRDLKSVTAGCSGSRDWESSPRVYFINAGLG
jgi:hypothetical protein